MKGVQAWDYSGFHTSCRITRDCVRVLDIGGFRYLECSACGVLANLDAVATKFIVVEQDGKENTKGAYEHAKESR